jgi:transposase
MRPPHVFAEVPVSARGQVVDLLHGRWRTATRLVMVLMSADGMAAADIADVLGYHPATVRRWLDRYASVGVDGLADRPRSGRPPIGGVRLAARIAELVATPGPWTVRRLWQRLGRPEVSLATLCRRTRKVACWRRPRLVARGDPQRPVILARLRRRLAHLPPGSVLIAEDEAHLDLLPHLRASWILRGCRQPVMTPGSNRRATVYGALDLATGAFLHLWAGRCAAGFIAVLEMLTAAYPTAPVIAVCCDNDGIHHAAKVCRWLAAHSQVRIFYGAAYSPHDNPVERIWAALKADIANTAVTFTDRIHQARIFFRNRTPTQMLTTAAPWSSPWIPPSYAQKFWSTA